MNLIIELIIKIFQGIFEKDSDSRKPPLSAGGNSGSAQGGASSHRDASKGETASDILAEFMRSVQGLEPPPVPKRQAQGQRTRPPRVPNKPKPETLAEHIRKGEEYQQRLESSAESVTNQAETHLGVDLHGKAKKVDHPLSRLPGQSPLAQMIYAGVLLGPCKARQRESGSRITRA